MSDFSLYNYCAKNKIPKPNFTTYKYNSQFYLSEAFWETPDFTISGIGSGSTQKNAEKIAIYHLWFQFLNLNFT